jgi:hypothetical protein
VGDEEQHWTNSFGRRALVEHVEADIQTTTDVVGDVTMNGIGTETS